MFENCFWFEALGNLYVGWAVWTRHKWF